MRYEAALKKFNSDKNLIEEPIKPKSSIQICPNCLGSGLIPSEERPLADNKNHPHVAIIGAGIGGVALALACLHRQIPFTLFEKDRSFNDRSQGYGLTLQQASKEMKKFGISNFDKGIISTLHLAHNTKGEVLGEWGLRNLDNQEAIQNKNKNKSTNIHIARQSLRLALLEQLGGENQVVWNHQLIDFSINNKIDLTFDNDVMKSLYPNYKIKLCNLFLYLDIQNLFRLLLFFLLHLKLPNLLMYLHVRWEV